MEMNLPNKAVDRNRQPAQSRSWDGRSKLKLELGAAPPGGPSPLTFGKKERMKKKIIAVWICALYFAVLFYLNLGHAVFGTLGVIRPGDTTDGMIEVTRANTIIQSVTAPLQQLTWLVGLGVVLLLCIALWLSTGQGKRGHKADEH